MKQYWQVCEQKRPSWQKKLEFLTGSQLVAKQVQGDFSIKEQEWKCRNQQVEIMQKIFKKPF